MATRISKKRKKRFNFPENGVELYAEKVNNRGLCANAQAVFPAVVHLCFNCVVLCVKVPNMLICLRRTCQINGKPIDEYIGSAVRHVLLSQGVLDIKVKIILD
ncbi:hypothetical protein C4D60_Mb01t11490 [Musa balbisiana]|uniref:Uncharacterized protein n=1 Tax=Musa balbisiana TaxID=52838 RepID=A0A4V4H7A8_MUSBA|nr:hypothetical protein C4D60_Mb01t11490 [Musa balbisiana]